MDLKKFCTDLQSKREKILPKIIKGNHKIAEMKVEMKLKETAVANWKKTRAKYEEKLEQLTLDISLYDSNMRSANRMIQQYETNLDKLAFYKKTEKKELKTKIELLKEQAEVADKKIKQLTEQHGRIQMAMNNVSSNGLGELVSRLFQLEELIEAEEKDVASLEIDLDLLTQSAIKRYGEEREGFLEWFKVEISKFTAIAKDSSLDVDLAQAAVKLIVESLRSKKKFNADLLISQSEARVKKSKENLTKIRKIRTESDAVMQEQRNLKVKTLYLTLEDVAKFQKMTDKVYQSVQEISAAIILTALCEEVQAKCHDQIVSLAQLEKSGSDFIPVYIKEVHKTLSALNQKMSDSATRLWGKVITEKGAKFIDLGNRFAKDAELMRASCLKAIEQGESFLPEAAERISRLHQTFEAVRKQQLGLLTEEELKTYAEELKSIQEVADSAQKILDEIKDNYPFAIEELTKLKKLLGDV